MHCTENRRRANISVLRRHLFRVCTTSSAGKQGGGVLQTGPHKQKTLRVSFRLPLFRSDRKKAHLLDVVVCRGWNVPHLNGMHPSGHPDQRRAIEEPAEREDET